MSMANGVTRPHPAVLTCVNCAQAARCRDSARPRSSGWQRKPGQQRFNRSVAPQHAPRGPAPCRASRRRRCARRQRLRRRRGQLEAGRLRSRPRTGRGQRVDDVVLDRRRAPRAACRRRRPAPPTDASRPPDRRPRRSSGSAERLGQPRRRRHGQRASTCRGLEVTARRMCSPNSGEVDIAERHGREERTGVLERNVQQRSRWPPAPAFRSHIWVGWPLPSDA